MNEVFLLKYGEMALKGLNRRTFEDILIKNLRHSLARYGKFKFETAQSTVVVTPLECADYDAAYARLRQVFGISSVCRAYVCEKDMCDIEKIVETRFFDILNPAATFKIEAKRADKKFPLTSPQIASELGGFVLSKLPHIAVDVHEPEVVIKVEIRDRNAFVHSGGAPGAGGIPVGSGGRALVMLSGGIDSPVAAYMMAKRGVALSAVYFHTHPYVAPGAKEKVVALARKVALYAGGIQLYVVNFTPVLEQMRGICPDELYTVVMRRYMVKIAGQLAARIGAKAIITGESLGQVASQTIESLAVTNAAAVLPVFRPLIGFDKSEIVELARKIGTFETSTLPFDDCCAVFSPRHPRTRPSLAMVEEAEREVEADALLKEAADTAEIINVRSN